MTTPVDTPIEHMLENLGFSMEESRAYLALLESGPVAAGTLAKMLGMPRPSVYGFLARLVEKGAATQTMRKGVKLFTPETPQALSGLFRDRREALAQAHQAFERLIPALEKKTGLAFLRPRFEFFEGREGLENVLKDMLLYSGIETSSFWPIQNMIETLPQTFFRHHNKIRIKNRVSVRALWPRDQIADIKQNPWLGAGKEYLREIRLAPPGMTFSMGYWIYRDKTAFLSSTRENFGFIIESRELAAMMQSQFDAIWSLSEKLKIRAEDMQPFLRELREDR